MCDLAYLRQDIIATSAQVHFVNDSTLLLLLLNNLKLFWNLGCSFYPLNATLAVISGVIGMYFLTWWWCAAVMLFPRYFCAVMLTYSVTRASNVWTQWNVVCSNYCILQRAELFLRINVCYECRCIFFHIFYTIVMFMKCCDFACTSHVYVGVRTHKEKNANCAECKWPVSILSCFCYIIHWNILDTFILEVFLALFALKWQHYIHVYNVLGSSGYSLH